MEIFLRRCFLCSENQRLLIPPEQLLAECEEITVDQILEDLHFWTISDGGQVDRSLCCICMAKLLCCYHLKRKCNQIAKEWETGSTSLPTSSDVNPEDNSEMVEVWEMVEVSENSTEEKPTPNCININIEIENVNKSLHPKNENIFEEVLITNDNFQTWNTSGSYHDEEETDIAIEKCNDINDVNIFEVHTNDADDKAGICSNFQSNPDGSRLYFCNLCGASFIQESYLFNHKINHYVNKPYVCDICSKSFLKSKGLSLHKLTHTGNEKSYMCNVCKKPIRYSCISASHKIIHADKQLYKCDVCDKSFVHPSELKDHKVIHSVEKLYVCDVCKESYRFQSNLDEHKKSHSVEKERKGKKVYRCDVCDKVFRHWGGLHSHKYRHMKDKPFVCDVCDKAFVRRTYLNRHKLSHTSKKS